MNRNLGCWNNFHFGFNSIFLPVHFYTIIRTSGLKTGFSAFYFQRPEQHFNSIKLHFFDPWFSITSKLTLKLSWKINRLISCRPPCEMCNFICAFSLSEQIHLQQLLSNMQIWPGDSRKCTNKASFGESNIYDPHMWLELNSFYIKNLIALLWLKQRGERPAETMI